MSDAQTIWRLGRWVAERPHGSARLTWAGGAVVLKVASGRIVGIEGLVMDAGTPTPPDGDVLGEIISTFRRRGLPETEGVASVKAALEDALEQWLLDPGRNLEIVEETFPAAEGPTISLSHAVVETVLVRDDGRLTGSILPDLHVMLRRTPGFLERYASLQLNEEADLIAAKITGQRTAEQIIQRTPHDREEVLRLLAALVAAGLLEPVPVAHLDGELADEMLIQTPALGEPSARRLPLRLIAAGAIVLLVVLAGAALLLSHTHRTPATGPRAWGVVVDQGCEPQDLQRILNKAGRFPDSVRAERMDRGNGEPCWELVWGHFASREEAVKARSHVPKALGHAGVEPKVVPLKDAGGEARDEKGAERVEH